MFLSCIPLLKKIQIRSRRERTGTNLISVDEGKRFSAWPVPLGLGWQPEDE